MRDSKVDILGIAVSRLGMDGTIQACEERLTQKQGGYVCFANVHSVTESTNDPQIKKALNQSFLSVADGLPLIWTSRLKKEPIKTRVCGPDFTAAWLKAHPEMTYGFIGGMPGRAEELAHCFGVIAICYSPPIRPYSRENSLEDWQSFLKLCPSGKAPAVVWVGLGAPKQELWMHVVSEVAMGTMFFGIGAAFDFLTGAKARAPLWMQENGLEWLYRLGQEPSRLAKRYLVTNSLFTFKLAKEMVIDRKKYQ
jgi:N-acetylglucosaminyldiphosphoundecaprenol N-acetyl-beta-D-mannosaminyltransferase